MAPEGFDTENWVERLAATLPALAEAQGPYLEDYWRLYPPTDRQECADVLQRAVGDHSQPIGQGAAVHE